MSAPRFPPSAAHAPQLAALPKVDRVAGHQALANARKRLGTPLVMALARRAIADARVAIGRGDAAPSLDDLAGDVRARAERTLLARARPVINATGVLLHTNLGRAPLAPRAAEALASSAAHYTSIEVDLDSGKRGARGAFAERAISEITGAEAALIVNNNAAAVLLTLSAIAFGKRVIVSRGELVEIGGGFRVPDVLARSGAAIVEIGTTNKTRLADYERAIDEGGAAAILCVHQGNFRQIGFVERPAPKDVAALAARRGVASLYDLGGGALIALEAHGLSGEPSVQSAVTDGFDLVCFSTDKALGGPQGGAIVGAASLVERARKDPLARALRLGRLPLVALEATLALYLEGALDAIPVLRAIRAPIDDVRRRAIIWRDALAARSVSADVVDLDVAIGGGTLAEVPLASAGLAIAASDPDAIAARLRASNPPVFVRIEAGRILVDARTVLPDEDASLIDALAQSCA